MDKEIWKDIVGYEGKYQVSNFGKVKSLDRLITQKSRYGSTMKTFHKGKTLVEVDNRNGYKYISLGRLGGRFYIHNLVAQAFIPNPKGLKEVNHKDFNKCNNFYKNLEWCSHKENLEHAIKKYKTFYKGKKIKCMETGIIFNSSIEASSKTGIDSANIRMVLSNKTKNKTAGGYHWIFI